jgi:predicted KAP-like P-loop ATPase
MKKDIKEILKYNDLISKYNKYILVIDDLDRCTPNEVVNLLDSLKIFLDFKNVIVIVAVDRRHIEK